MNVRKPAVAGAFYPETPEVVRQAVEGCFRHRFGPGLVPSPVPDGPRSILALVCPHAGYAFSGPAAGYAFSALAQDGAPELVVIVGPNHRGLGAPIAVGGSGYWETPIGRSYIDEDVAKSIASTSKLAEIDDWAHLLEHSVEVQLPFLHYLFGESFRFVPIIMATQDPDAASDLGQAIGKALQGRNGLVIASTDFSHYEPQAVAERQDALAIDAITHLDELLLAMVVKQRHISMCGVGPVIATLVAAKLLGATKARLLKYITSGDITGDTRAVVGYASMVVEK